jgi:hypothetical protein
MSSDNLQQQIRSESDLQEGPLSPLSGTHFAKHEAAPFLTLRQLSVFKQVISFNLLRKFIPSMCILSVVVYVVWVSTWIWIGVHHRTELDTAGGDRIGSNQQCTSAYERQQYEHGMMATTQRVTAIIHLVSTVIFLVRYKSFAGPSSIASDTHRAIYSYGATVCILDTVTHLLSSVPYALPIVVNSYFYPVKAVNIILLGKWLSLKPLVMVVVLSLNVRSTRDLHKFYEGVLMQIISVGTGVAALVTRNQIVSWVLLTTSCVTYLDLFLVLHHKYRQWQRAKPLLEEIKAIKASNTVRIIGLEKDAGYQIMLGTKAIPVILQVPVDEMDADFIVHGKRKCK